MVSKPRLELDRDVSLRLNLILFHGKIDSILHKTLQEMVGTEAIDKADIRLLLTAKSVEKFREHFESKLT